MFSENDTSVQIPDFLRTENDARAAPTIPDEASVSARWGPLPDWQRVRLFAGGECFPIVAASTWKTFPDERAGSGRLQHLARLQIVASAVERWQRIAQMTATIRTAGILDATAARLSSLAVGPVPEAGEEGTRCRRGWVLAMGCSSAGVLIVRWFGRTDPRIIADPVVICSRCGVDRVLPAVPGSEAGICYRCHYPGAFTPGRSDTAAATMKRTEATNEPKRRT